MKFALIIMVLANSAICRAEEAKTEIKSRKPAASTVTMSVQKFVDHQNSVVCYYLSGNDSSSYRGEAYGWGAAAINCLRIENPR